MVFLLRTEEKNYTREELADLHKSTIDCLGSGGGNGVHHSDFIPCCYYYFLIGGISVWPDHFMASIDQFGRNFVRNNCE